MLWKKVEPKKNEHVLWEYEQPGITIWYRIPRHQPAITDQLREASTSWRTEYYSRSRISMQSGAAKETNPTALIPLDTATLGTWTWILTTELPFYICVNQWSKRIQLKSATAPLDPTLRGLRPFSGSGCRICRSSNLASCVPKLSLRFFRYLLISTVCEAGQVTEREGCYEVFYERWGKKVKLQVYIHSRRHPRILIQQKTICMAFHKFTISGVRTLFFRLSSTAFYLIAIVTYWKQIVIFWKSVEGL